MSSEVIIGHDGRPRCAWVDARDAASVHYTTKSGVPLGAGDFIRRNLDVSYSGSPKGQRLSAARSGSTHPTDPQGQAAAEPHR